MIRMKDSMCGECPTCGSIDIDYDALVPDGGSIYYPATCEECGQRFFEYHELEFDAHYVKEEIKKESEPTHEELYDKIGEKVVDCKVNPDGTYWLKDIYYKTEKDGEHIIDGINEEEMTALISVYENPTEGPPNYEYTEQLEELGNEVLTKILEQITT